MTPAELTALVDQLKAKPWIVCLAYTDGDGRHVWLEHEGALPKLLDALASLETDAARLTARVAELEAERDAPWSDKHDEWTAAIDAAFPTKSGSHAQYATARQMVSNRHSKGALVALVSWLLVRISALEDTIDLERAQNTLDHPDPVDPSDWRPRETAAARTTIAEIESRRGAGWKGARE